MATATFPKRSALTREHLHNRYADNKRELTKHVNAAVGAKEQFFGGQDWFVRWYEAPPGAEYHNGLEHQDLPVTEMAGAIDVVKTRFGNRQFTWVTGPSNQAPLDHFLRMKDFSMDEQEPVMVADLMQHPDPAGCPTPAGVTIECIDASSVVDWAGAWAYGAPKSDITHWADIYTSMVNEVHPDQFRMYLARKNGRAVGTGYIHCFAGVAAVHAIVVRPEFRRQGIGKALTAYGMQQAAALDYNVATLTASALGFNTYKSLGFEEFGTVKLYTWRPLQASNAIKARAKNAAAAVQPEAKPAVQSEVKPAVQPEAKPAVQPEAPQVVEDEDDEEWEIV